MGESAIQYCRCYALEAERKMGQMLAQADLNKGGNPNLTGNHTLPVTPTLKELGVTKRESSEAQRIAALPKKTFEAVRNGDKTRTERLNDEFTNFVCASCPRTRFDGV